MTVDNKIISVFKYLFVLTILILNTACTLMPYKEASFCNLNDLGKCISIDKVGIMIYFKKFELNDKYIL